MLLTAVIGLMRVHFGFTTAESAPTSRTVGVYLYSYLYKPHRPAPALCCTENPYRRSSSHFVLFYVFCVNNRRQKMTSSSYIRVKLNYSFAQPRYLAGNVIVYMAFGFYHHTTYHTKQVTRKMNFSHDANLYSYLLLIGILNDRNGRRSFT